jgi:hypothetical protein
MVSVSQDRAYCLNPDTYFVFTTRSKQETSKQGGQTFDPHSESRGKGRAAEPGNNFVKRGDDRWSGKSPQSSSLITNHKSLHHKRLEI